MTDTIIKGTGNSRSIRSVPNLAALAPTYDKLLELFTSEDGFPIDLLGPNPLGCDVVGTVLNKANLLTDETAAAHGLTPDATVDDALKKLVGYESGSYAGTGSSNFSITFSINWKVCFVFSVKKDEYASNQYAESFFVYFRNSNRALHISAKSSTTSDAKISTESMAITGNSIQVYSGISSIYYYIAIG